MNAIVRSCRSRGWAGPGAVLAASLGAFLLAGLVLAGPASAHVTVHPEVVAPGDYVKLDFRVPDESETAGTVKLTVSFPTDHPFASVRVKPHSGWTAKVRTSKLPEPVRSGDYEITEAVTSITWTARKGVRIGPEEFDEFEVSAGPVPEAKKLAFPAQQTYDDGTVVAWDDATKPGGAEPEHPAPAVTPRSGQSSDGQSSDGQSSDGQGGDGQSAADAERATSDDLARSLGAAGLVVGALGLGAASWAWLSIRRQGDR